MKKLITIVLMTLSLSLYSQTNNVNLYTTTVSVGEINSTLDGWDWGRIQSSKSLFRVVNDPNTEQMSIFVSNEFVEELFIVLKIYRKDTGSDSRDNDTWNEVSYLVINESNNRALFTFRMYQSTTMVITILYPKKVYKFQYNPIKEDDNQ